MPPTSPPWPTPPSTYVCHSASILCCSAAPPVLLRCTAAPLLRCPTALQGCVLLRCVCACAHTRVLAGARQDGRSHRRDAHGQGRLGRTVLPAGLRPPAAAGTPPRPHAPRRPRRTRSTPAHTTTRFAPGPHRAIGATHTRPAPRCLPLAPSGSLCPRLLSPTSAPSPRCCSASTRPPPSPPRWATFLRRPSQRPSSAPPCLRPRPAPPSPPAPAPPPPPPASAPPPPPPSTLPPPRRWMRCPRAAGRLACCPRRRRRRAAASRCCRLSCRWWCRLRCLCCR